VGHEGFPSERGSFSILAMDALRKGEFRPDFDAFICTKSVRYIRITKESFQRARDLDQDHTSLELALCQLATEAAGEVHRKEGKKHDPHDMQFESDSHLGRDRDSSPRRKQGDRLCGSPSACLPAGQVVGKLCKFKE